MVVEELCLLDEIKIFSGQDLSMKMQLSSNLDFQKLKTADEEKNWPSSKCKEHLK